MKLLKVCLLTLPLVFVSCRYVSDSSHDPQIETFIRPFDNVSYTNIELKNIVDWSPYAPDKSKFVKNVENKTIQNQDKTVCLISNSADQEFSLSLSADIPVNEGEVYLLSVNVLLKTGIVKASFVERDENRTVLNWVAGSSSVEQSQDYKALYSLIFIPENVKYITPRITGKNITYAEVINAKLEKVSLPPMKTKVEFETNDLKVECLTQTASFNVTDKRSGKKYEQAQKQFYEYSIVSLDSSSDSIILTAVNLKEKKRLVFSAKVDSDTIEYSLKGSALGSSDPATFKMNENINFPQKNLSTADDYLVLPINEGMCFDATDSGMPQKDLYYGEGLSMPFYGITSSNGGAGLVTILETPDDGAIKLSREENLNCAGTCWKPQKKYFGYERKARQIFLKDGAHVSIAKKYREYAKETGLLVTFEEKMAKRGAKGRENLERFLGCANIWSHCNKNTDALAKSMMDSGIDKILWSNRQSAATVQKLNTMGILTGCYDIYQDVLNPAYKDLVTSYSSQYLPEAYPGDVAIKEGGGMVQAWPLLRKDGTGYINCVALCDMCAPKYARNKIPEDLKTNPFGSRYMDTVTASVLRECYSPSHPMTKTQSREKRYELLKVSSEENGLVTGSENGMDFCVPVCDYFSGMMSLYFYRIENAGRNTDTLLQTGPSQIYEYQLNEKRRLPLWELVYHDCCVAMWIWGDCNNKITDAWDKRDLFDALYAVPPMYWVNTQEYFDANKTRLVQSYKTSSEIVKKAAGVEMTNHEFLSADRSIQRTTFANGTTVTVNFNTKKVY